MGKVHLMMLRYLTPSRMMSSSTVNRPSSCLGSAQQTASSARDTPTPPHSPMAVSRRMGWARPWAQYWLSSTTKPPPNPLMTICRKN